MDDSQVMHSLQTEIELSRLIQDLLNGVGGWNWLGVKIKNKNLKQKKVAGEAANYVIVNELLFKITQHKESGKWVYYLPLVIPEKLEANILNMYHNSFLAMHQGPYRMFLTI